MNFKYQATTLLLRQQLRGHLSQSTRTASGPSEPQFITWGLLNDFEQAVQILRHCQLLPGKESVPGAEIHTFLFQHGLNQPGTRQDIHAFLSGRGKG
ncbi:MAG: hypothetical protein IPP78_08510 [Holophagaceae bacterium]|nr:hypothetical protein [Holophagaceae bacterium]